ncbi:MAG: 50S ribosomal protein L24 [Pirellulaceae bacterium]
MKIHKGDTVKVLRGRDAGVQGKVVAVYHGSNRVLIEGVNKVYKHVRPSQKNPQGGRLHKEMPIDASKVMVICPKTNKATRVGYRFLNDGSKERFAKVSGASLGVVSPAKAAYAKK